MERNDFRITNLHTRVHGTQRWQSLQDRVGQFVTGDFLVTQPDAPGAWTHNNDSLEFLRSDVAISILVKVVECLPQSLSLVSFDKLGEFRIWTSAFVAFLSPTAKNMSSPSFPNVQLHPVTVKVER